MIVHDFSVCPRCGFSTQKATSYLGTESEFWYECTNPKCNTYINTYIPQEHQMSVHKDTHRFIMNAGGFGSGKTTTSREEWYKHAFLTPNGVTVVGANVAAQYEQTIKKDIESDIPRDFVKAYSTQKAYMDLINGHRIMYRPFDDAGKLRSLNVSMFIMIEASECKEEIFTQLKTRLRNMTASIPMRDKDGNIIYRQLKTGQLIPKIQADWRKGIIETNPDSGWVRSEVLLKASDIQKHGTISDVYSVIKEQADPSVSAHITSADCNEYLPESFIPDLKKNKPYWWQARYIYGSFSYSEGLVYPNAMRQVCETFEIPTHWRRVIAFDYGLVDPSAFIFAAIDESNSMVYVYKEVRRQNNNVEELAKAFKDNITDIPVGGMLMPPLIDPKSGPKRDFNKKTLSDYFLDYGIAFQPGQVDVTARIVRLNTYIETGRIKIMDCCTCLIEELRDYKWKPAQRGSEALADKPVDRNNHSINALEWITMELPANPANLITGIYNKLGKMIVEEDTVEKREMEYGKWVFQDEDSNKVDNADYPFEVNYVYGGFR